VVVSGGVGVRLWMENPQVKAILSGCRRVVVAAENEGDSEKQERTDGLRRRLLADLLTVAPQAQLWYPAQGKDLAEFLAVRRLQQGQQDQQGRHETQQPEPQKPFPHKDLGLFR